MKISKKARQEARQLFRSCRAGALLDENRARQVVNLLITRKPRGFLPILMQFKKFVALDATRRSARIESAAPLQPEMRDRIQSDLQRSYGEGLNYSFAENPALLGGLRIQVGGDVYDGSVQARLKSLRDSF